MTEYTTAGFLQHYGEASDDAATAPVIVTKHKKPHRVLLSWKQYQELIGRQQAPRRAYGVNELPDDLGAVFDKGLREGIEETERGGE